MDEDHEEKKLSDVPLCQTLLNFKTPSRNGGNLTFLINLEEQTLPMFVYLK